MSATINDTLLLLPSSSSSPDDDVMKHLSVQIIFYTLYATMFLLGLTGNVLVCYIVYTNRAMQTVTNMFITNLAISDILLCVLAVPFTPLYTFLDRWLFGQAICHLVPYAQATSVYVSTLTLTAIAIDRFFVIIHPLRERMKVTTCGAILAAIWFFAMAIALPYGVCMKVAVHNGKEVCEEDWRIPYFEVAFGVLTLLLQFVAPFCIIAYCYWRISTRLNQRAKSKPGTKSARREEADREMKRRTNRMLIAMVAIFGVCWFPLNAVNLINDVWDLGAMFHLTFFLTHCMAVSSTCYNPFLYAWLNENFRKEFKQILPCPLGGANANRLANADEYTLDTLLNVSVFTSPTKQSHQQPHHHGHQQQLEPRAPIAERIAIAQPT